VVGLLILSVALGTVLHTATRGVKRLRFPGTEALALVKTGVYFGVYQPAKDADISVEELGRLAFTLSRTETGRYLPVESAPGGQALLAGGGRGALLFRFEAPEAGEYLLDAVYPAGAGPTADVYLIHESVQNNRSDIAAGVVVCLLFVGFGVLVLVRTRRAAAARAAGGTPG
jgi:hypothetical protein